jgi:plastocyanin
MGMLRYRRSMVGLGMLALGTSAGAAILPTTGLAKAKHPVVKLVKVEDDFYSPKKLTIKRGNQINFIWNKNNVDTHNVMFLTGPKGVNPDKFSSGTNFTGVKFKPTFTKVGTYHFRCTIHRAMRLTVIVRK